MVHHLPYRVITSVIFSDNFMKIPIISDVEWCIENDTLQSYAIWTTYSCQASFPTFWIIENRIQIWCHVQNFMFLWLKNFDLHHFVVYTFLFVTKITLRLCQTKCHNAGKTCTNINRTVATLFLIDSATTGSTWCIGKVLQSLTGLWFEVTNTET